MFHITVGTSPSNSISLENDLEVLKAALLYADKVKLCSLTTSMLLSICALRDLKPQEQIDFFVSVLPIFKEDPEERARLVAGLRAIKQLGGKKHLGRQELLQRQRLLAIFAQSWRDIREKANAMLLEAGMDKLMEVIEADLLELHVLGIGQTDYNLVVREYFETLTRMISDGSTYPLFDAEAGDLIRLGIREGKIEVTDAGVTRGRHSGLAANLLERLPLFEEASITELLDIRRELEKPLVRFRGALVEFSGQIKTAAWDEDFASDADQVFMREVAPAILDLEEAVRSNNYLATLARRFVDKPLAVPGGSALAMFMSQLTAVPEVVTQALGIGATSGLVAYDAYKEWRKQQQAVEQNQLYFYYRADRLLSNRTYEYRKD